MKKLDDEYLVNYVISAKTRAKTFRDSFMPDIDECVEQYNCTHPDVWKKKEEWQSKIFIPMAYKNVEVGASMLIKMLLSQKDFYDITGVSEDEEDLRDALKQFIVHVLQKGNFYNVGALAVKEACVTSTCFIKTLDVSKGKGDFTLNFIPRTFHDVLVDPSVAFYWINSRFVIDEYEKDIADILESDLYTYGKPHFEELKKGGANENTNLGEERRKILDGINNTGSDKTYKPVSIAEFHGKVKDPDTQKDVEMLLTVANDKYLIQKEIVKEDERPYDVIRVNPNAKQFYGAGLIKNTRAVSETANSVINLWMDNWKLAVMQMVAVDKNADVDWDTVEVKPAAIWHCDPKAIKPIDMGMTVDGMAVLSTLDQILQETYGISRTAQGQQTAGADETLGEVQIKLSRSDNRFLQMAKFIEAEWLGRSITKIIKYTIDKCPQSYVDKIMGFKEVERNMPVVDALRNVIGMEKKMVRVRKLDIEYLRKNRDIALDFRPIGISRFMNQSEEQTRYNELLKGVLTNEMLMALFDVKKVVKRAMQSNGFENIEDLMKSNDEIDQSVNQSMGKTGQIPDFPQSPTEQQVVTPELKIGDR